MPGGERVRDGGEPAQPFRSLDKEIDLGVAADLADAAFPCGSAWKWVIPALHPVYGSCLRSTSCAWLGRTSPVPWIVGVMLVYSNDGMPYRPAIAFIASRSWAFLFDKTQLIRIVSPASCAASSPRMNRLKAPCA